MPIPITLPRLGWNMEQGTLVAWLKRDGEQVRTGEPLFTLEGDKATQDVEATDDGVLHLPADAPQAGAVVAVGTTIGYLLLNGEAPATSPLAGLPATPSKTASPRARRAAAELGVDWKSLPGTGRGGRVRERDVRASARKEAHPPGTFRHVIARRMVESLRATAPVTLTTTADATNLVSLRQQFKAAGDVIPSYTDVIARLVAVALQAHPALNARWTDDRVVFNEGIHIGIAVDTHAGLIVPVLRDVAKLGLRELAAKSRELIERARQGRLAAEEMRGGTFTISNLGAYGVDAFTPIINHPECAILGLGAIRRQPVVVGEAVVPRDVMTLSLTFDHRIVDGAPAARFLGAVRRLVENPAPALVG